MSVIRANRWENNSGVLRSTVLQTVNVSVNQNFSYTISDIGSVGASANADSDAGVDISPLSITITPTLSTSRILIIYYTFWGVGPGNYIGVRIKRGIFPAIPPLPGASAWANTLNGLGTQAVRGTASITNVSGQHNPQYCNFQLIDTPNTTSPVTYLFNIKGEADQSTTVYLNRVWYNNNDYGQTSGISTVTAMEIAQ
jgi:hypothetical protein